MLADLSPILSLEVPLIVLLGERRLRLSEVTGLAPGAIIELPKHSEEELTLLVNNKPVGAGSAVKVGENFGIRITFMGDLRERIAALGAVQDAQDAADFAAATAARAPNPDQTPALQP